MSNKVYSTSDFYLACFLKARGLPILNVEREGRRSTFIFEDNGEVKRLVLEFYNDGKVEVNAFKNAIQDLRSIIYNF